MSNCSTSDAPLAERSNKSLHKMCVFRGNISEMKTLHRMHSKLVRCQFIEETLKVVAPVYKYTNTNTQIQIHKYINTQNWNWSSVNFGTLKVVVRLFTGNSQTAFTGFSKESELDETLVLQFDFEAIIYTRFTFTLFSKFDTELINQLLAFFSIS